MSAKGTYPAPWGETKGMYPETNTLPKQHTPSACGGDVDFLGKKGILNEDDFTCLKTLYGMRRHYYIKDDEFPAIIELYKQKIKGILSDEIIEPIEDIPEYNITRLFKLKLLGRISLEKFETMKELLRQYMGYKSLLNSIFSNTPDNELKKEEKGLLLFLMENGPED